MMSNEERLLKLEHRMTRWQAYALVATLLTMSLIVHLFTRSGGDLAADQDLGMLKIGNAYLSSRGVMAGGIDDSNVNLLALPEGPTLALKDAKRSMFLGVDHKSDNMLLMFNGEVTSELVVDTHDGSWRLTRYRKNANGDRIDVVKNQLLPPLP